MAPGPQLVHLWVGPHREEKPSTLLPTPEGITTPSELDGRADEDENERTHRWSSPAPPSPAHTGRYRGTHTVRGHTRPYRELRRSRDRMSPGPETQTTYRQTRGTKVMERQTRTDSQRQAVPQRQRTGKQETPVETSVWQRTEGQTRVRTGTQVWDSRTKAGGWRGVQPRVPVWLRPTGTPRTVSVPL